MRSLPPTMRMVAVSIGMCHTKPMRRLEHRVSKKAKRYVKKDIDSIP